MQKELVKFPVPPQLSIQWSVSLSPQSSPRIKEERNNQQAMLIQLLNTFSSHWPEIKTFQSFGHYKIVKQEAYLVSEKCGCDQFNILD